MNLPGFLIRYLIYLIPLITVDQDNEAPNVRILSPQDHGLFEWGSLISYDIEVSDKEDGLSEYGEIAEGEVILKVKYLSDSAGTKDYLLKDPDTFTAMLQDIVRSGCFNCHSKKDRNIGPSFEAIANTYSDGPNSLEKLTRSVVNGSRDVWGTERMPPFTEADEKTVRGMISWVLNSGRDTTVNFLPGLRGSFPTIARPFKEEQTAVYVLTATYTDHGDPAVGSGKKSGSSSIVLKSTSD